MRRLVSFTFVNGSAAWTAMRAFDRASYFAGYPSRCGGFTGPATVKVLAPGSRLNAIACVAYMQGATTQTDLGVEA